MIWSYHHFPVQEKKIYDYYIDDEDRLQVREYDHYVTQTARYGNKTEYRIHTGKTIVIKPGAKLDRVLNNHYWTFEKDPDAALSAMLERAHADAVRAAAMAENARRFEESIRKAVCQNRASDKEDEKRTAT